MMVNCIKKMMESSGGDRGGDGHLCGLSYWKVVQ